MPDLTVLPIKKIAVLRALKLGDFLLFIPAARALRAAFPEAQIDYIGLPWNRELVERFSAAQGHYFDNFVEFPGFPELPERVYDVHQVVKWLAAMQARRYDLVLQMHGGGRHSNTVSQLLGGRYLAGYRPAEGPGGLSQADPAGRKFFLDYPEVMSEVRRRLTLLEYLGVVPRGQQLEFPVTSKDRRALAALSAQVKTSFDEPYACLHAGSISARPWPPAHFAAVADALAARGLKIVLTGTAAERATVAEVQAHLRPQTAARTVDLSGRTELGALAALLQRAKLVVAGDTGVSHLAEAVGAPSITIFTTTDPRIWAPEGGRRHPFLTSGQAVSAQPVIRLAEKMLT